jgi:hypothetical protein
MFLDHYGRHLWQTPRIRHGFLRREEHTSIRVAKFPSSEERTVLSVQAEGCGSLQISLEQLQALGYG